MTYCRLCVLPDSRPGLVLNDAGICSACVGHAEKRDAIAWDRRRTTFEDLVAESRSRSRGYDCLVPVSGGKDSTWQIVMCRDYGLRTLAMTWKTPGRTEIGQQNLDNLVALGVDHIDYTVSPQVERRFMYQTLRRVGDTAVPMHMAMYALPLRLALALRIPLVVWGESPHMEYGGSADDRKGDALDLGWFQRHGILQGTSAADWVSEDLTVKDLEPYFLPPVAEFETSGLRSIFLGFYFQWDPEESLRVALAHGFRVRAEGPKTGYWNYADIDCDFISVHHYFKWFKFGFTRLFDNVSVEIRNGRMTRERAIEVIAEAGDQTPLEDIDRLCRFLGISTAHFWEIAETFRNQTAWKRVSGRWTIPGFLVPDWCW